MVIWGTGIVIAGIGVYLGLNGLPLQGFIIGSIGGLLPFVWEPIKSMFKKDV